MTAIVTATAAAIGQQRRPAPAQNTYTIHTNLEYVRPAKQTVEARGPHGNLASDEEAAGSNPATPATKPQVTRHPMICGSRFVSPDVRFWEPKGSGRACWRAGYRPAVG